MRGYERELRKLGGILPTVPETLTREERIGLLKLMCELEILDRDILVRKFLQGMASEEIALHMGLKSLTVDNRIDHAIKKWEYRNCSANKRD